MRITVPTLAVVMLAGWSFQTSAHARCPELTELRITANQASKEVVTFAGGSRCDAYVRSAMAWNALLQYANDHRESCEVSATSLTELEKLRQENAQMRDNVCAGRPAQPYPADIIQR